MADDVKPAAPPWLTKFSGSRDHSNGWLVPCPVRPHGGFDVLVGHDPARHRWTIDCLEGCSEASILHELGLTERDLFYFTAGDGLRSYSSLTVQHVDWVIPGHVPQGMLTVLAGEQGLGKSLLHARWASELSKNEQPSILISAEDSPTHTTKARLMATEANQDIIYDAADLPVLGNGHDEAWLARMRQWVERTDARLMVFDPMMAFIDAATDSYKAQHVRRLLSDLDQIAKDSLCAIVYVMHLTKAEGANPLKRISGAGAWTEAARSVVLMTPEHTPHEPQRILAHVKCNVAEKAQAEQWEIEPILIPNVDGRDVKTARITYRGQSDVDVSMLLIQREPEEATARDTAVQIIREYLWEGAAPSTDVERACREAGVSPRTYDTARAALGVRAHKRGKVWYSQLPGTVTKEERNGKDATSPLRPSFSGQPSGLEGAEEGKDAFTRELRPSPEDVSRSPSEEWPW